MPNVFTQLKGSVKLGATVGTLVEYNTAVFGFQFKNSRTQEVLPATMFTGEESVEAGTRADTLTLMYLAEQALTGLFSELEDAHETDDAELFFEIIAAPGSVSAANPKFSGRVVVDRVEIGGEVGKSRQNTAEYSIKAGSFVIANS